MKHEKVNDFVENLNSCEFLEGLSCYQPFEHITCHLTMQLVELVSFKFPHIVRQDVK